MSLLSRLIAWRYVRFTSKEKSIGTMAKLSFLGIMIGSFSLALVLAIMSGFEKETYKQLQGIHSSIIIEAGGKPLYYEKINEIIQKEFPEIVATNPSDIQHIMIEDPQSGTIGQLVMLRGIYPDKEAQSTILESKIIDGTKKPFALITLLQNNSVLVGSKLAETLHLEPGDPLTLVYASKNRRHHNKIALDKQPTRVGGIFKTGIEEFDANVVVSSFTFLQSLFLDAEITSVGIKINPEVNEMELVKKLRRRFPLHIYSWQDMYPALVSALALEKYASFFILCLIVLVACMSIISLLFMQITIKRGDIAILKAMGASNSIIYKIFLYMGLFISFCGTLFGLALAWIVGILLKKYHFIKLPDAYYISHLPVYLEPTAFMIIFFVVMSVSFFAIIFSLQKIGKINIAEVLKFEA